MTVWAMGVEYLGTNYHGWQSQSQSQAIATVQDHLEQALAKINDDPVKIICAGRTDSGVHALNQVVHFTTTKERSEHSWVLGANQMLPRDISVRWAKPVADDFHARFSALARRYHYLIDNRPLSRPAAFGQQVTWIHGPLQEQLMQEAADSLIGRHDFSAFRSSVCQAHSPVRTIHNFTVCRSGHLITIDITANAFLHHMVRNLAGTLIKVGSGEWEVSRVQEILASQDRRQAAMTAKPNGLYFADVHYPEHYGIPQFEKSAFLAGTSQ